MSTTTENKELRYHRGTVRLIMLVSSCSVSQGVRGES